MRNCACMFSVANLEINLHDSACRKTNAGGSKHVRKMPIGTEIMRQLPLFNEKTGTTTFILLFPSETILKYEILDN